MPVVIQNWFAKCGFGTLSEVSSEEDQESKEQAEFQGHMDCPSNFDEFLKCQQ
jgi:hypothetical protein